jgi:hypothetical protein
MEGSRLLTHIFGPTRVEKNFVRGRKAHAKAAPLQALRRIFYVLRKFSNNCLPSAVMIDSG